MPGENYKKEIPSLTGVRFVLVSMVFMIHYVDRFAILGNFSEGIINQFYLSLHMFFVLSGFVICYKYYDQSDTKRSFLFNYYLKRFSKIYPVFFLLTTFTYFIWSIRNDAGVPILKEWLLNISFIKGFSSKYFLAGIGPSWSLTVEELFYFFSPFVFLLIKTKRIFFSQIIFWWTVGGVLLFIFREFPYEGFFSSAYFVYFTTFFGRCFEFYCGIFLALVVMNKVNFMKVKLPSFTFPFFTIIGALSIITLIFLLYFNQYYFGYSLLAMLLLSNILFPIGVILFYAGLINEASFLQNFFSNNFFQLLGKSSYAFFLVHTGVIAAGIEKYVTHNVILLFIILYGFSIALFLIFERPFSKWIRLRFGKPVAKQKDQ
ncbi:MAG TPA: acyltransferase [Chitinophagaceae bacterium]|nr:acyltransferase [Chitinophagaceae bacterium]